jgi:hypothetical protein
MTLKRSIKLYLIDGMHELVPGLEEDLPWVLQLQQQSPNIRNQQRERESERKKERKNG